MTFAETMEAARAGNAQKTAPINSAALIQKLAAEENARKAAEAALKREADAKAAEQKKAIAEVTKSALMENPDIVKAQQEAETMRLGLKPQTIDEKIKEINTLKHASGVPDDMKPDNGIDAARREQSLFADRTIPKKPAMQPDPAEIVALKSPKNSAIELASAKPSQAAAVIEKLKEEEKKGGPNFFDIIQAAAAGWNGQVPAYVKKAMAEDEQKKTLEQLKVQAAEQAKQSQIERDADFQNTSRLQEANRAFDQSQFAQEMALKREAAGLSSTPATGASKGLELAKMFANRGK